MLFLEKYFCVPLFRADKRARIIIEGCRAAFPMSFCRAFLYINRRGEFRPKVVVVRIANEPIGMVVVGTVLDRPSMSVRSRNSPLAQNREMTRVK